MADSVLDRTPPPSDRRIIYGNALEQFADLRLPDAAPPFPALAFIHGGFWRARYDLLHAGHLCAAFTAAGVATWNLEYRRLGDKGGGWPGTFQDIALGLKTLFDRAPGLGIDPARIVVAGHSAGGHLALWSAGLGRVADGSEIKAEPLPLKAAISLAGVVDLREALSLGLSGGVVRELLDGAPDEAPERYAAASPIELTPLGLPQLLVHGELDEIVPISISRRYLEAANEEGDIVALLALPDAEHFAVIDPESVDWPEMMAAILPLFD
jgi:acetyl esterase/lipase